LKFLEEKLTEGKAEETMLRGLIGISIFQLMTLNRFLFHHWRKNRFSFRIYQSIF
jgi:hypothetical protein